MSNNLSVHDKLYKILSEKYKIPYTVIEKVCRHELEFVAKTMRDDKKFSVRLKYLGLFGVKSYRERLRDEVIRRHKEIHGEEKEKFYKRLQREKLDRDNQGYKPEEPLV